MKLIVALCLIAVVAAAPPPQAASNNNNIELLRYDNDPEFANGSYSFSYEQSDGQRREEQGEVKKSSIAVKGTYHWVGPDGVEYTVIYIADENGYKPEIQQGPGGALSPVLASMVG